MPASQFPLDLIQRWMQAVIETPGDVSRALAARGAERELPARDLGRLILPSRTLSARERIGVYQGMYLLRMGDALASDYPGVAHLLGEEGFAEAVRGYLRRTPSRSYTLNRLGDGFPRWLARARRLPRRALVADLARLELLTTQVFDAEERPPLVEDAIARVDPGDWARARLLTVPAFGLAAFRWPVADYLDAVRAWKEANPPGEHGHHHLGPSQGISLPRARASRYAVYRRNYALRRLALDASAFHLLAGLAAGVSLGRAIAATLRRFPRAEARLFDWLSDWTRAGIFAGVEVERSGRAAAKRPGGSKPARVRHQAPRGRGAGAR